MKILVIEPAEPDQAVTEKNQRVISILEKFGHDVHKTFANISLYEHAIQEQPDLVFNLAGNGNDSACRIPAILEIADIKYTGSCMMALSFNRFYNLLFPLLADSGILTVPFKVMKAGQSTPLGHLQYPLLLFQEGSCNGQILNSRRDLSLALDRIPIQNEVIVFGHIPGERVHLFLLDGTPIKTTSNLICLEPAVKAFRVMEARGLARFDFLLSNELLLVGVDMSPHPLDENLMKDGAESDWDAVKMIQYMVEHAGRD